MVIAGPRTDASISTVVKRSAAGGVVGRMAWEPTDPGTATVARMAMSATLATTLRRRTSSQPYHRITLGVDFGMVRDHFNPVTSCSPAARPRKPRWISCRIVDVIRTGHPSGARVPGPVPHSPRSRSVGSSYRAGCRPGRAAEPGCCRARSGASTCWYCPTTSISRYARAGALAAPQKACARWSSASASFAYCVRNQARSERYPEPDPSAIGGATDPRGPTVSSSANIPAESVASSERAIAVIRSLPRR